MRDIVNALVVRDSTLLLARRSPHRTAYPCLWSFPGGHVEPNESLDEALIRELCEEVGINPTRCASLGSFSDPNAGVADPVTYHMFVVTTWDGGEPTMRGDEHTELGWFTLEAAVTLPDLALEEYRPLIRDLAIANQ